MGLALKLRVPTAEPANPWMCLTFFRPRAPVAAAVSGLARFARDSPLEGDGFEPLVPRRKTRLSPVSQKSVER